MNNTYNEEINNYIPETHNVCEDIENLSDSYTGYYSQDEAENTDVLIFSESEEDSNETIHHNTPVNGDTNNNNNIIVFNTENDGGCSNTTDTLSILSNIQTSIINNIHRDSHFINSLSPDDLSVIINNHINNNGINLETPENALDALVEIINNNPLITSYIGSSHNIESMSETDDIYEIDDELMRIW